MGECLAPVDLWEVDLKDELQLDFRRQKRKLREGVKKTEKSLVNDPPP